MDLNISLLRFNLCLHLIVFEQQLLSLLRLVLELRGQLMVLQNGQPGSRLELLVVQSEQVRLGLLNLVEHLLS